MKKILWLCLSTIFVLLIMLVIGLVYGNKLTTTNIQLLNERVSRLEQKVEKQEETANQEIPSITTSCVFRKANGPSEVPFKHAVMEISGKVNEDLWLEAVVNSENKRIERHFLIAFMAPTISYKSTFDGYVSSIRGDVGYQILLPKLKYVLRGWHHPYTESTPQLKNLAFEIDFEVLDCGNWN